MGHTLGLEYKKSLPNPRSLKFSPVFSSSCSILYVLYSVRSIINFGLIFFCIVQSVDPSSFIYFLHMGIQLFEHRLLKRLGFFFPPAKWTLHPC